MEIPRAKIITVRSSKLDAEEEDGIFGDKTKKLYRQQAAVSVDQDLVTNGIANSKVSLCQQENGKIMELNSGPTVVAVNISNENGRIGNHQHHIMLKDLAKTDDLALFSVSTTLAEEEGRLYGSGEDKTTPPSIYHDDVSRVLEWFRSVFSELGRHDRVTLKDMKRAVRECEVLQYHSCI